MKQNDLCKMMGTSKSVLQRTRKDLGMSCEIKDNSLVRQYNKRSLTDQSFRVSSSVRAFETFFLKVSFNLKFALILLISFLPLML
jgi:hypothetical protein